MCSPGYLDDYAGVGGKWQRSDPAHGRVGSVFSDPGAGMPVNGEQVLAESDSYEPAAQEVYDQEWSDDSGFEGSISDTSIYEDESIMLGEEW